jgi:hypothetical protein
MLHIHKKNIVWEYLKCLLFKNYIDEIVGKHVILVLHTHNFCVRTCNAVFVEENVVSE